MGICGIIGERESNSVDTGVASMLAALRRPLQQDKGQLCVSSTAGLGAIGDTASIWSSELVTVTCDADLLNRNALGREAAASGATTLAGLIATLYLHNGMDFVKKLHGSFSFAIWDKRAHRLFLTVDRFGINTAYYALTPGRVCFASRPRAVFATGHIAKTVDPGAILDYLNFTAVPLPKSAYTGLLRVEPGTYIEYSDSRSQQVRYWDLHYPEDARGSTGALAAELLAEMDRAVREAATGIPGDRLGCFLSGGTDSSSVVGLLDHSGARPVNTFSIGFAEQRFNELEYAHIAARHFVTQHHEALVSADQASDVVESIIEAYDEPFANSSAIPTYFCLKLARDHGMEYMLAGDGGDELFGGNERYRTNQIFALYQHIPRLIRRRLIEPVLSALPISRGVVGKARRYIQKSNTPNPERYFAWGLINVYSPEEILDARLAGFAKADLLACPRAYHRAADAHSELNRLLYIDIKMTLGDNDLPKVVVMSELAGVKVRFPYLDHILADFSGTLPARLKVAGLEKRYLFKRATRDLLPKSILQKKKHGFGLPIGLWLKSHPKLRALTNDVLLDPRTYQRGYFRRAFVERLFASMDQDDTPYYGDLLWSLLALELWHRRHVEANAACA